MHPHVHASMFLSQKTSKGEERKPEAPEKLLHIRVAGLMISSKGSVFLKQEIFFLSDKSPYPVWTRLLHSETHDDKITQRTVCLRGCTKPSKQYPSPLFLCTQNVTAELLLLLSLRTTCLCYSKVFAYHSSQIHLKTCLWSQGWSELLRFGDHYCKMKTYLILAFKCSCDKAEAATAQPHSTKECYMG